MVGCFFCFDGEQPCIYNLPWKMVTFYLNVITSIFIPYRNYQSGFSYDVCVLIYTVPEAPSITEEGSEIFELPPFAVPLERSSSYSARLRR